MSVINSYHFLSSQKSNLHFFKGLSSNFIAVYFMYKYVHLRIQIAFSLETKALFFLLLFLSDVLCIFLFIESHTISEISFVRHLFLLPTTLIFCSQLLLFYSILPAFDLMKFLLSMSCQCFILSSHTISYKWLVIFVCST